MGLWAMHLNGGGFTTLEFAATVALGVAATLAPLLCAGAGAYARLCGKRKRR